MVGRVHISILILLVAASAVEAQQVVNPTMGKNPRGKSYRSPLVSRSKARIICPIFESSGYPYHSLGVKVGDPVALTYKFYPNKHWAFAVDAGQAASGLYSKYYRKVFSDYLPDSLQGGESLRYFSHKVTADWLVEGKFVYQFTLDKISPGLQLYAGLGWQWRYTTLQYTYLYEEGSSSNASVSIEQLPAGEFTETRSTYGPVGVLGFEYSNFALPLSAFIEIEGFMDALLDPGYKRFQGGAGIRYVF